MKTITAPTLIMTGDEDWPCLEPALLMKRTIPTAVLVVMLPVFLLDDDDWPLAALAPALRHLRCPTRQRLELGEGRSLDWLDVAARKLHTRHRGIASAAG